MIRFDESDTHFHVKERLMCDGTSCPCNLYEKSKIKQYTNTKNGYKYIQVHGVWLKPSNVGKVYQDSVHKVPVYYFDNLESDDGELVHPLHHKCICHGEDVKICPEPEFGKEIFKKVNEFANYNLEMKERLRQEKMRDLTPSPKVVQAIAESQQPSKEMAKPQNKKPLNYSQRVSNASMDLQFAESQVTKYEAAKALRMRAYIGSIVLALPAISVAALFDLNLLAVVIGITIFGTMILLVNSAEKTQEQIGNDVHYKAHVIRKEYYQLMLEEENEQET